MNEHTTTTAAQARELARELRELSARSHMPRESRTEDEIESDACNMSNFMWFHATDIAATLDALATQCERLREENELLRGEYADPHDAQRAIRAAIRERDALRTDS
jgi:hypothetical protein